MTLRAIVLGLLGASVFCGFTYFNDAIMRQTMLVGNNMPMSVYGALIVFLLVVNPALFLIARRLALSGRELAVILALTLVACCIPGSGLLRSFTSSIMMPHHYAQTEPGWKEQGVIDMVPEVMLVDGEDEGARTAFVSGMRTGQNHISLSQIPWSAWVRTLAFWMTVILALWIGLVALAVVVHRQWSDHEQLPYPIATFTNSLLPEEGQAKGSVFGSKLFWLGLAGVLLIHLNNYGYTWYPNAMMHIPLKIDMSSLAPLFPTFQKGEGSAMLMPTLYFTVIAFAYFLATDVSLSLAIGPFIFCWIVGFFAGYGISIRGGGDYMGLKLESFLNFGSYFGILMALLYTGRHYYRSVFSQAVRLRSEGEADRQAVWGARVFLVCMAIFVLNIAAVGLDWQLAVLYAAGVVIIFLVMGRIVAETGMFFLQPYTFSAVILWGLFGAKALGPEPILIMLVLGMVLMIDPREALMPFVVNALKLVDMRKVKVGRTAVFCGLALVVGLGVALPLTMYFQYDRGANMSDMWATKSVPQFPFKEALRVKQRLIAQESLECAESLSGWQRFAEMSPDLSYILAFGAGLGLVLLFTALRLRLPKWPLHPILFVVWASMPGKAFAVSFLLGWFVKMTVMKYGGASTYQRLKPLMFGLIGGDMLGGLAPTIIGAIYHSWTGEPPKTFNIMPG